MTIPASKIFGSNVTLNTTDPDDPILLVHLKDFENSTTGGNITDGSGLNDASLINSNNLNSNASRILVSMIKLHLQEQPESNDDETNGTYLEFDPNFNKNFTTRNGIGQIVHSFTVNAYTNDTIPALDPDDVVS